MSKTAISHVNLNNLRVGMQVAYVPSHARESEEPLKHPATEFGFVTSWKLRESDQHVTVYCRFFSKRDPTELRTVSCSEACDVWDVFGYQHTSPVLVNKLMEAIYGEEG